MVVVVAMLVVAVPSLVSLSGISWRYVACDKYFSVCIFIPAITWNTFGTIKHWTLVVVAVMVMIVCYVRHPIMCSMTSFDFGHSQASL